MTDWKEGEPPLDRDVEFERNGQIISQGRLTKTPVIMNLQKDLKSGDRQYRLNDQGEIFTVTRWRDIQ